MLVGSAVKVHHHARQSSTTFLEFTKVKQGNLKAILGRDILQLPVLLQLKPVSIAASFQFVDVRAIENQVPKAH